MIVPRIRTPHTTSQPLPHIEGGKLLLQCLHPIVYSCTATSLPVDCSPTFFGNRELWLVHSTPDPPLFALIWAVRLVFCVSSITLVRV